MSATLALVGRPNVGKSTLFNRLTASRRALVAELPGLTRDRQYGYALIDSQHVLVIDTGGLMGEGGLAKAAEGQTWAAVAESDAVLFLVDVRSGVDAADELIAKRLRESGKPVWLLANKVEGLNDEQWSDVYRLGFQHVYGISATRGVGLDRLKQALLEQLPKVEERLPEQSDGDLRISVMGRPNVGKSTLINRLIGQDRVLASSIPGTTRDAIYVPLERSGQRYILIDTAGFRRRSRVETGPEKLGISAGLRALDDAMVAIVVIDSSEGITAQDQRLIRLALERGRGVVVAQNKWDGLSSTQKTHALRTMELRLDFAPFVPRVKISALYGTGLGELMKAVDSVGRAMTRSFSTGELNRILEGLIGRNPPPMVRGRRIKLRYVHPVGYAPPHFVVHGSQTGRLPASYRRYLASGFGRAMGLVGVPLLLDFKTVENPYQGRPAARHSTRRK